MHETKTKKEDTKKHRVTHRPYRRWKLRPEEAALIFAALRRKHTDPTFEEARKSLRRRMARDYFFVLYASSGDSATNAVPKSDATTDQGVLEALAVSSQKPLFSAE